MNESEVRKLVSETIAGIGMGLADIFGVFHVPDELIWKAMRQLDRSHARAMSRIKELSSTREKQLNLNCPRIAHPALDALLLQIEAEEHGA